jgi:hypothetical protein
VAVREDGGQIVLDTGSDVIRTGMTEAEYFSAGGQAEFQGLIRAAQYDLNNDGVIADEDSVSITQQTVSPTTTTTGTATGGTTTSTSTPSGYVSVKAELDDFADAQPTVRDNYYDVSQRAARAYQLDNIFTNADAETTVRDFVGRYQTDVTYNGVAIPAEIRGLSQEEVVVALAELSANTTDRGLSDLTSASAVNNAIESLLRQPGYIPSAFNEQGVSVDGIEISSPIPGRDVYEEAVRDRLNGSVPTSVTTASGTTSTGTTTSATTTTTTIPGGTYDTFTVAGQTYVPGTLGYDYFSNLISSNPNLAADGRITPQELESIGETVPPESQLQQITDRNLYNSFTSSTSGYSTGGGGGITITGAPIDLDPALQETYVRLDQEGSEIGILGVKYGVLDTDGDGNYRFVMRNEFFNGGRPFIDTGDTIPAGVAQILGAPLVVGTTASLATIGFAGASVVSGAAGLAATGLKKAANLASFGLLFKNA